MTIATTSSEVCPVCLLPECTREHPDCSPPARLCERCGNPLRTTARGRVCGLCLEEAIALGGEA